MARCDDRKHRQRLDQTKKSRSRNASSDKAAPSPNKPTAEASREQHLKGRKCESGEAFERRRHTLRRDRETHDGRLIRAGCELGLRAGGMIDAIDEFSQIIAYSRGRPDVGSLKDIDAMRFL